VSNVGDKDEVAQIGSAEPQRHRDVRVNHPSIVSTIQNMIRQGRRTDEIMRVVGMPQEVINNIRQKMEKGTHGKG